MSVNEKELAQRNYLGRYQHVRLLGEGGMALVCLAQREKSNLQVVVKVMQDRFASDPKCREAFRREIDFMKRFRHPHAVGLFEGALDDPAGPCIVMEFVDGVPLNELLLKEKRFAPDRTGRLLAQLGMALQTMHLLGFVHRDLKAGNLMVLDAGTEQESVKLLDFGLARKITGAAAGGASPFIPMEKISDFAEGTPEYMSPEHLHASEMDHRADIYSVGIILYELCTGQRPFNYEKIEDLLKAHAYDDPPSFAQAAPGLALPGIENVVRACLAKDPEHRPQSARELVQRFEKALGQQLWDERIFREMLPPASVTDAPEEEDAAPERQLNPNDVVFQLEAWMPEAIAVMKLRGFLNDLGGEVTDSVPGMIRVYLKRPRASAPPKPAGGFMSWIGLKKDEAQVEFDLIEMEVHMEPHESGQANHLLITILLSIASGKLPDDWQGWCDNIAREISAYLMAKRL